MTTDPPDPIQIRRMNFYWMQLIVALRECETKEEFLERLENFGVTVEAFKTLGLYLKGLQEKGWMKEL